MCLIKQRANNPEQKALRKQQILEATRRRFQDLSYEEVNLNHIAADVGITKAALYRYFRNKETLFLALFVESLNELITTAKVFSETKDLAQVVTGTLINNPLYCKLSAILHTILERNLSIEEAISFKRTLLTLMGKYADLLVSQYSDIDSEELALGILMQVQEALIGTWHMTHPSGSIASAIETPPLNVFKRDFATALNEHVQVILHAQLHRK